MMAGNKTEAVELSSLNLQQLGGLKQQLDQVYVYNAFT